MPVGRLGTQFCELIFARTLKAGSFNANILTDIVYHKVSYLLLAQYPMETILHEMVLYAGRLLKNDVDGNDQIDVDDLLKWDPVVDRDKVAREWSFFEDCIGGIQGGTPYLAELFSISRNVAGTADLPGNAFVLTVSGNYAYVATQNFDVQDIYVLQVIDISNPANPTVVGAVDAPGFSIRALAVSDDFAYAMAPYGPE